MNTGREAASASSIDIRFGQMGIVQVRVRTTNAGDILDELTARVATAPRFFDRAAVTIDVSALPPDVPADEVRTVLDTVRRAGMIPVGLSHGTGSIDSLARSLGLPVMSPFRAQDARGVTGAAPVVAVATAVAAAQAPPPQPTAPAPRAPAPPPARPAAGSGSAAASGAAPAAEPVADDALPSLLHRDAVRSGQRLYARHRDLVVTAAVGAGAEVIADGCVHVYGPLRGRALAGARGATDARIFCQEFHAELVSIAGVFRVFETLPADLAGKPVQAWLEGDELLVARIGG